MAFSICEVVRVVSQSRSWFVYAPFVYKPTTPQTRHANDFANAKERKLCSQCTHFCKAGAARKVSIQFKLLLSKTVRSYSFAIDNISRVLLSLQIF